MPRDTLRLLTFYPNFKNIAKAAQNSTLGDIKNLTNFHCKLMVMLMNKYIESIDFGHMFEMFTYSFKPEFWTDVKYLNRTLCSFYKIVQYHQRHNGSCIEKLKELGFEQVLERLKTHEDTMISDIALYFDSEYFKRDLTYKVIAEMNLKYKFLGGSYRL